MGQTKISFTINSSAAMKMSVSGAMRKFLLFAVVFSAGNVSLAGAITAYATQSGAPLVQTEPPRPVNSFPSAPYREHTLQAMGIDQLHPQFDGSGAAVVNIEPGLLYLGATNINDEKVFGNCKTESGADGSFGWSPREMLENDDGTYSESTASDRCKVAWVMCFAAPGYLETRAGKAAAGRQDCTIANTAHATTTAAGIATIAPGADIIAIDIGRNDINDAKVYRLVIDWLLNPTDPANAVAQQWYDDNGFGAHKTRYARIFRGQSPAEFWGIVSLSGSMTARNNANPLYSQVCSAEPNPGTADATKYILDWHRYVQGVEYSLGKRNPGEWKNWRKQWPGQDGVFTDQAELDFELDEWQPSLYRAYDTHSKKLRQAGIMPIFAAHNYITKAPLYRTPNGVSFPACLNSTYAVSGISARYQGFHRKYEGVKTYHWEDPNSRDHYVGSNAHPELTDMVVPAGPASSYGTPVAAAAVAVMRSAGYAQNATLATMEQLIAQSNYSAPVGETCKNVPGYTWGITSPDLPSWADPSLACEAVAPYRLPVLSLGVPAAINIQYPSGFVDVTDPETVVSVDLLGASVAAGDERDLDVWFVREGTVHFGPQRAVPVSSRRMDHDGDGINDKRFFFRLGDTGIRCDNADDPVLTGEIDHDPMQDEEDFSPLIVAVGSVATSGCE
jgi:hypothetical protein